MVGLMLNIMFGHAKIETGRPIRPRPTHWIQNRLHGPGSVEECGRPTKTGLGSGDASKYSSTCHGRSLG